MNSSPDSDWREAGEGPPEGTPDADGELRYEGRLFPSEAEWLSLPLPPDEPRTGDLATGDLVTGDLTISPNFVERTVRALREQATAEALERATEGWSVPRSSLSAFVAPEPSTDFVDRTLALLRTDRRSRWREMLARHVVPEPSPQFVALTLAALAADRQAEAENSRRGSTPFELAKPPRWRRWSWPVLAIAAGGLFWLTLARPKPTPSVLRLAQSEAPAFAHTYAASPVPALLASLADAADPYALPSGAVDGVWLLMQRK